MSGVPQLLAIAAACGAALAIIAAMLSVGIEVVVTPPAEQSATQFVKALEAHRYPAARLELSESAQEKVTVDDLRALVKTIEEQHGGIGKAQSGDEQQDADSATVTIRLDLDDGQTMRVELPLRREQHIWRVESIDPLEKLTRSEEESGGASREDS
jgi:hypothetical protein